jgi:hypothetical protein
MGILLEAAFGVGDADKGEELDGSSARCSLVHP